MTDVHQWASAEELSAQFNPSWVGDEWEKARLSAYTLYESLYLNVPFALEVQFRGANDNPIYIPSGRQIIDTLNRYLARGVQFLPDPTIGSTAEQQAAAFVLRETLKREKFQSKFTANKLEGTYRGDWAWHLYADPNLPPGARISILPIDPGTIFPEYDEDNPDNVTGYKIAEEWLDTDQRPYIRVLRYWKESGTGGPSRIIVSEHIYNPDKSGLPGVDQGAPFKTIRDDEYLPEVIDHLPIYPIPNVLQTGSPFGRSELQGLERLISAISQTISDEELALALEGLGVYWTDSGPPLDDDDNPVPWNVGPARVVEVSANSTFGRVAGVGTVQPSQDHLKYLHRMLDGVSATPAIAKGDVSVEIAESGISLILQMGPLLAKCEDKELIITDVMSQMFYDLRKWFVAYEDTELANIMQPVQFLPVYGPKLPINEAERFNNILRLWNLKLVDAQWVWEEAAKIGYDVGDPTEMTARLNARLEQEAKLSGDPFGDRMGRELDEGNNGAGGDPNAPTD